MTARMKDGTLLKMKCAKVSLTDRKGNTTTPPQTAIIHIVCPDCKRGYIAHVLKDTTATNLPGICKKCKAKILIDITQ